MMIGDRKVGGGTPCLIMAEIGLAHDGSMTAAHSYIDAVADAGADAVKFQCHTGDTNKAWRIGQKYGVDRNRQRYWDRTAFTVEQWTKLAAHAKERGLIFLCSPFSVEAVAMLDPLVPAWKVPSGKATYDDPTLKACISTGKPLILSAGMMRDRPKVYVPHLWLLCTSLYPCPPDKIGLSRLLEDDWYQGLSDHSGTIWPGIAAATMGVALLEVHVCLTRKQWGFDTDSSITVEELGQLVNGIRFIEKALRPVDRQRLAQELRPMIDMFVGAHA